MHGSTRVGLLAAGCAVLLVLPGCASLAKPTLPVTQSARAQQRRAVRFDPYPQDDIGPYLFREPLMDGTRPRDYNEPVAEIRRSRWWSPVR
jgi:hypothetical protein